MRPGTLDIESDSRRSTRAWALAVGVTLYAAVAVAAAHAQGRSRPDSAPAQRQVTSSGAIARRDHPLRAVQLLEYRPIGADARVRFEWDQVAGAREYRLVGRWTGTVSWAVKTRAYAVTARNATSWTSQRVTFEAALPLGNHSWRLVAVFGPNDLRTVGDSTPLSFAVK